MIWFCYIWFLLLYGGTFMLSKSVDVLSPLKFVSLKLALVNLPFILYTAVFPDTFIKKILSICNVSLREAFKNYTIVQTVAFLSLVAGIIAFNSISKPKNIPLNKSTAKGYSYKTAITAALIFFVTGFGAYIIYVAKLGGIEHLVARVRENRVSAQAGHYILILLPFLTLAGTCLLLCVKRSGSIRNKILYGAASLVIIAVFSSFGSRKDALMYVIIQTVASYYFFGKIRLNKRFLTLGGLAALLLAGYILIIPVIRNRDLSAERGFTLKALVYNTSYTFIDVFAANYFDEDNAWYMKGYFEPFRALGTKQDRGALPQMDQGVYFHTIVFQGRAVAPPIPRAEVSSISWPTENFGFAYANFLMPGIVVFFFLLGVVYTLTYRFFIKDIYNPILIVLYVMVIFTFDFSSLRIAAGMRLFPVIAIGYIIMLFLTNRKIKQ